MNLRNRRGISHYVEGSLTSRHQISNPIFSKLKSSPDAKTHQSSNRGHHFVQTINPSLRKKNKIAVFRSKIKSQEILSAEKESKNATEHSTANSANSRVVAFADIQMGSVPQIQASINLKTIRSKQASQSFAEIKQKGKIMQIQHQIDSKEERETYLERELKRKRLAEERLENQLGREALRYQSQRQEITSLLIKQRELLGGKLYQTPRTTL